MSARVERVLKVCPVCQRTFGVPRYWAKRIHCGKTCADDAKRMPDEENFWRKVDKNGPLPNIPNWTLGPCWLWTAYTTRRGYGMFAITDVKFSHPMRAHRWSYQSEFGPLPTDRPVLDHLCRVRHCVRPSHLEPVTYAENIRRGQTGKWQVKKATKTTSSGGRSLREVQDDDGIGGAVATGTQVHPNSV